MKKAIIYLGLMGMGLASCDKQLDLEPLQSISEENVIANDQNVKRVLNGAYDGLSSGALLGGDLQFYSELLAADAEIAWVGTFSQLREIYGKDILTTNSYVRDTWLAGYNTINISNNVLGALDVVTAADKNRVEGEAKFIRGTAYFELVKLFAKPYVAGGASAGIPIVLQPTRGITEESKVARASIQQVYDQIIQDLTDAETKLPVNQTSAQRAYASKRSASAMLSRVYLQMEKYAEARDAANRTINYGSKTLTASYDLAFNNDDISAEDLFAIEVNDQDGANDMQLFWSVEDLGGRGDVEVQDKHLGQYEPNDDRLNMFYVQTGAARSGKWAYLYKNLPVARLAEMYLTRAECNERLGTAVGATVLQDINRVRARVDLDPLATVTLDAILKERKLELAFEGQRIHDVKRTKGTVDGFAWNANKLVFPIPQREMDANPNLVQNDGY